jgi:hypothetical protein
LSCRRSNGAPSAERRAPPHPHPPSSIARCGASAWAAVLEDEEKLSRFVSFVNAPDLPDPSIRFVNERDQIRPADDTSREPVGIAGPELEVVRR